MTTQETKTLQDIRDGLVELGKTVDRTEGDVRAILSVNLFDAVQKVRSLLGENG